MCQNDITECHVGDRMIISLLYRWQDDTEIGKVGDRMIWKRNT